MVRRSYVLKDTPGSPDECNNPRPLALVDDTHGGLGERLVFDLKEVVANPAELELATCTREWSSKRYSPWYYISIGRSPNCHSTHSALSSTYGHGSPKVVLLSPILITNCCCSSTMDRT